MTKTVFVVAYLTMMGLSHFYAGATDNFTNLGVSQDMIDLVGEALDITIKTVGAVAVAVLGLTLPEFPTKVSTVVEEKDIK